MLTYNSASVNIVLDGNSNIASSQISDASKHLDVQLAPLNPLLGNVPIQNFARGGATFKTMYNGSDGSGIGEVLGAFQANKQNILIIGEATNSSTQPGVTLASMLADQKVYLDAVKASNPAWRIFLMTMTAGKDDGNAGYNTFIDQYNTYIRAHYWELGAEGYIELRPNGGPYDYYPPYVYTESTFVKSGYYRDDVHWSDLGVALVAGYIANYLKTIPAVAPTAGYTPYTASVNAPGTIPAPAGVKSQLLMANGKPLVNNGRFLTVKG